MDGPKDKSLVWSLLRKSQNLTPGRPVKEGPKGKDRRRTRKKKLTEGLISGFGIAGGKKEGVIFTKGLDTKRLSRKAKEGRHRRRIKVITLCKKKKKKSERQSDCLKQRDQKKGGYMKKKSRYGGQEKR